MLAVSLDDVLSALRAPHDEPTFIGLDEDIVRPRTLSIVDHLPDRAPLS